MNNDVLFNNFNLTNEEIESVLSQIEKFIDGNCYVNGKFNDDLKQDIYLNIFITLSKNRKK